MRLHGGGAGESLLPMLPRSFSALVLFLFVQMFCPGETLPGTAKWDANGDLPVQMVAGIRTWLTREASETATMRREKWHLMMSDVGTREESLGIMRVRLKTMIGAVDLRNNGALEVLMAPEVLIPTVDGAYRVERVRWPVFDGVNGEGLILLPRGKANSAVIVLPDADVTPEQIAGVAPGLPKESQIARRLAERGAMVIVMALVDRRSEWSGSAALERYTNASHREWIHRQAFECGRTVSGFEVEKVRAAIDALRGKSSGLLTADGSISVAGVGEGGRIALFTTAIDPRIHAEFVSGAFGIEDSMWAQPLDRNLMGYARHFGDAELAAMAAPRRVFIESASLPEYAGPTPAHAERRGAAPGTLRNATSAEFAEAIGHAKALIGRRPDAEGLRVITSNSPVNADASNASAATSGSSQVLELFMTSLGLPARTDAKPARFVGTIADADERQQRIVEELEGFSQRILHESERVRNSAGLWTEMKSKAEWESAQKTARARFWKDGIGKLPGDYLNPNAQTRLISDGTRWRGYEVKLDVQDGIFAWGTLLVPKDLNAGERRPVVVCQHGLEGLPEHTITTDETSRAWRSYKAFGAKLCERGFIVFAPHNPYRSGHGFRMIQRQANPLGLSLFSFIIAQHDVATKWLASLPFVDPDHIAFYGLSYGGKTAMRVPAALDRYCLSICSGDFNEWVKKCASTTYPASYVFTGEWEIWEWDLAHTFNYAEMAMLIAPRPFMVERGHDDRVALDEFVAYEFAKVRRGYAKLGIPEKTEIEWFNGPHTIHGVGTFRFLHRWLNWPEPK